MSFPILISSQNYVAGNQFAIDLPASVDLSQYEAAVDTMFIYYSWYNISAAVGNNTFSLTIPSKGTFLITLPDGAYNISTLNNYLQFWFISNGYFITNNTTGVNTYYAAFQLSPQSYKVQFITTALPTSTPAGFTAGFGFSTWGGTANQSMQLTLTATQGLRSIIGFVAGSFPPAPTIAGTTYTAESTVVPNVNPQSSIQCRLNCLYNTFSSNTSLLHVFSNNATSIGALIDASPPSPSYVPCQGIWNQLTFSLFDQSGNPLQFLDTNITVKLVFRAKRANI